jgi:N-acetylmuramoyl-L-alanine amidase
MIKIEQKLIKYNFTPNANTPKYIVIHDTGNKSKGANAEMHYRYFNGGNRKASAHYFVDDKKVLQAVLDKDKAWHVGKGKKGISNSNTIGIEICVNADGDYSRTFDLAVQLTVQLMDKYNIPLENVIRHHDCSSWGKACPRSMADNNWAKWYEFKERVAELNAPPVDDWKKKPLEELHEAGHINDLEGWSEKLDSPAPNWLVFLLVNSIRNQQTGCPVEAIISEITKKLN